MVGTINISNERLLTVAVRKGEGSGEEDCVTFVFLHEKE